VAEPSFSSSQAAVTGPLLFFSARQWRRPPPLLPHRRWQSPPLLPHRQWWPSLIDFLSGSGGPSSSSSFDSNPRLFFCAPRPPRCWRGG
jgi:hypothetical protein